MIFLLQYHAGIGSVINQYCLIYRKAEKLIHELPSCGISLGSGCFAGISNPILGSSAGKPVFSAILLELCIKKSWQQSMSI